MREKDAIEALRLNSRYCKEELVAETGAAFLCAKTGISPKTIDNQAAYIQGWIDAQRGDSKLVVQAGAQAQKAVDLILGKSFTL